MTRCRIAVVVAALAMAAACGPRGHRAAEPLRRPLPLLQRDTRLAP